MGITSRRQGEGAYERHCLLGRFTPHFSRLQIRHGCQKRLCAGCVAIGDLVARIGISSWRRRERLRRSSGGCGFKTYRFEHCHVLRRPRGGRRLDSLRWPFSASATHLGCGECTGSGGPVGAAAAAWATAVPRATGTPWVTARHHGLWRPHGLRRFYGLRRSHG